MNRQKTFYYAFLCLAVILGGLLIWISTFTGMISNKDVFSSMGGAILGASASILIASVLSYSELGEIHQALSRLAGAVVSRSGMTSDVALVQQLKDEWYCYTVSQREGQVLWKVVKYKFSIDDITGEIKFVGRFKDNVGKTRHWNYTGMRRDERFIVVGKSDVDPQASCVLQIFPYLGNITQAYYSGITFHRTWDGVHSISPSIISREPIENFKTDNQASEELSNRLDELWELGFRSRNELILPRILDRL